MTDLIQSNFHKVQQNIETSALMAHREPGEITLLAVSKNFAASEVLKIAELGHKEFAENYVQEGVEKVSLIKSTHPQFNLIWHFIGPLQSNKTKLVAEHFDWVLTIDRVKIAQRLNEQRPKHLSPLQVCIQVNIDGGPTKSGLDPTHVLGLAKEIGQMSSLELRGLMTIPDPQPNWDDQVGVHLKTKQLFESIKSELNSDRFDTLSMGMSADLSAAISSGSTMVRVGTAIFGERKK
jgi:pyridoxal phosphate enzyme (YggS family)